MSILKSFVYHLNLNILLLFYYVFFFQRKDIFPTKYHPFGRYDALKLSNSLKKKLLKISKTFDQIKIKAHKYI